MMYKPNLLMLYRLVNEVINSGFINEQHLTNIDASSSEIKCSLWAFMILMMPVGFPTKMFIMNKDILNELSKRLKKSLKIDIILWVTLLYKIKFDKIYIGIIEGIITLIKKENEFKLVCCNINGYFKRNIR